LLRTLVCFQSAIGNRKSATLLRLLMTCMLAATAAELTEFQTVGRRLLVLGRYIIATLTIRALQYNIVTRHNTFPDSFYPTNISLSFSWLSATS